MQRSRRGIFGLSVWCFVLLAGGLPSVWAAPVTTVLNTGDPANRVDLAILGDSYTAAEMSQYVFGMVLYPVCHATGGAQQ
jgi:hypothetical protein